MKTLTFAVFVKTCNPRATSNTELKVLAGQGYSG